MQINIFTKQQYNGNNNLILNSIQKQNSSYINAWCTFNQARDNGFKVRKGEHGTKLVRVIEIEDTKSKQKENKIVPFVVFNFSQLDEIK